MGPGFAQPPSTFEPVGWGPYRGSGSSLCLIHRSAWKGYSANFGFILVAIVQLVADEIVEAEEGS